MSTVLYATIQTDYIFFLGKHRFFGKIYRYRYSPRNENRFGFFFFWLHVDIKMTSTLHRVLLPVYSTQGRPSRCSHRFCDTGSIFKTHAPHRTARRMQLKNTREENYACQPCRAGHLLINCWQMREGDCRRHARA